MRSRFGLFEFDDRTGELRRDGDVVKLSPQPARVLALLVAKPGEVVLREELRAHIWGNETFVDFERGLNFCILQVRTALGDSSENPRFVQTVPRKGYRFIAPVAGNGDSAASRASTVEPTSTNLEPAPSNPQPAQSNLAPSRPERSRGASLTASRTLFATACIVLLAPLALLLWTRGETDSALSSPTERVRIAVLPFTNLTGDANADYFAEGITDELIAQLGRVNPQRLGVIARTSVMRYRKTEKSVSDIGRELDVRYVIEGSVRREGERVRITTELVTVADQAQVWSDAFERPVGASMDLQSDLATRVARALTIELIPGGPASTLPRTTKNAEAWDAYLRGRYWLARGGADVQKSIAQFETAVKLDPDFAAAWAQLAEAEHAQVMVGLVSPMDAYPRAADAAARALVLDDSLADAHVANGIVQLWFNWQPARAAKAFERAIDINPSHPGAHHDYAWSLVGLGRADDAVREITIARDLDPLSVRANADIGWLFLHLRRPADAARACQHTLAIQQESREAQACLERAYFAQGLYSDALRAATAAFPTGPEVPIADGNAREQVKLIWRTRLLQLETAAKTRWVSPYQMVVAYAFVGEVEGGIRELVRAVEERAGVLAFVKTDPAIDPLRSDPRFEPLRRRIAESAR